MKLKLPKPKSSAAKAVSAREFRLPGPLDDLYRDMRDRRLLLPALILIVAVAAVPFALSADREPAPEPLAFVPPKGTEQVAPAVFAEQPIGVRDYRQRLETLKLKNPFSDKFSAPEGGGSDDSPGPDDGSPIDPGDPSPDPVNPAPPAPAPTPPNDVPPPSGDDNVPEPPNVVPDPEIVVFEDRITALAGPFGKLRDLDDVEPGDLLPSRKTAPVAMFLGASTDLKDALFAVSHDVTATAGDGRCAPRPKDCQFLRLRDGEKQFFTYGPRDRRYAIKVTRIKRVEVDGQNVEGEQPQ